MNDPLASGGEILGETTYEAFLEEGDSPKDDKDDKWLWPEDEWDAISLNYTSGTTGNPKGVVYHHRGAALLSYGNLLSWNMTAHPVYLWTLPMFHCNGWCFPWALSVVAGTHICLRNVEPSAIHEAMKTHGVTHLCGAPIVMRMIVEACTVNGRASDSVIEVATAAAPPPAAKHRRDGKRRVSGDAPLRAHRDIRSVRGERVASRMGTRCRSKRGRKRKPGRECDIRCWKISWWRTRKRSSRCPETARPWVK